MEIIANVRVGEPDVSPSAPSHVAGVREGNEPGRLKQCVNWWTAYV